MLFEAIKANVLVPATTRIGSLTAGGLVTLGMTQPHADAVALGTAALLGFGVDLMLAWFRKRAIERKAGGVAGDFIAWLMTRDEVIKLGASEPVYPAIDALDEYRRAKVK